MNVEGTCHCGYIRFTAEVDPEKAGVCHCTDCQTLSGSPFRVVVPTRPGAFELRSGEPTVYVKTTAESGQPREQAFCPHCGTPLYSAATGPGPKVHNVRTGTLRERGTLEPKRQIWTRSRIGWLERLGRVPSHEKDG